MKIPRGTAAILPICLLAFGTSACSLSLLEFPGLPPVSPQPAVAAIPTPTALPRAETVFVAALVAPLPAGESLALAVLDEITGLALNPQLYPMQSADGRTYSATLALPYRSVVKYRYVRMGAVQVPEDAAVGGGVRYRLYFVSGPGEVHDLIAKWSDTSYAGETGIIQGRVRNADTGVAIPNILVTAGGRRAFSDSAGRFELSGLPVTTHNLLAYAIDGTYETFQQGATIAAGLSTAVEINVRAVPLVRLTFRVRVPEDIQGVPVRLAGSLFELGNTFADLEGGISTVVDRMPVLALQPDGSYSLTTSLPAGAYLEYKYTLGDGFWNAEHTSAGEFRVRQLIVPSTDTTIQDQVETWKSGTSAPILFEVNAPRDTPASDLIYIQFNPFGWTEPIPMWPMGNGRWSYKLYGPVNTLGSLRYRYCRNAQCGSADDLATAGAEAQGRALETSLTEQNIKDTISDWTWFQSMEPGTLAGTSIASRSEAFVAGVEFLSDYRPNWMYFNPQAVQSVQALGANWLILTPSWTFSNPFPLAFGPAPEQDPLWPDCAAMVAQARAANLNVAIFAVPHFVSSSADFWDAAARDPIWWQNWYDHYRAFVVNYADLAAEAGAQALILGGEFVDPALPGGTLADGSASGVPADAESRWQAILNEARQHFSGQVWWAAPYVPGTLQSSFRLMSLADRIYLLWSAPLVTDAGVSAVDMAAQAGLLLDNEIEPLASLLGRPVVLALGYPSAVGVASGCLSDGQGACLDWSALDQPNDRASVNVDLQAQADVYAAMLDAINSRSFIEGIVSRGYYPPVVLQDKSASVHGKPAADLLWYWFPRLTGVIR